MLEQLARSDDLARLTQQTAVGVELLARHALDALSSENSVLRRHLDEARIHIDFLEGQLHALTEAHKTGRPRITRAVVGVIAAIGLAAAGGIAQGVAGVVAEQRTANTYTAADLVTECNRLQELIDATS